MVTLEQKDITFLKGCLTRTNNVIPYLYFRTVVLSCAFTVFLHLVCGWKFKNLIFSLLLDLPLKSSESGLLCLQKTKLLFPRKFVFVPLNHLLPSHGRQPKDWYCLSCISCSFFHTPSSLLSGRGFCSAFNKIVLIKLSAISPAVRKVLRTLI